MNTLEQVRTKIIELVPEQISAPREHMCDKCSKTAENEHNDVRCGILGEVKIIGRPINLEHVLKAVQSSGECWKLDTIMDSSSIRLVVKDRCLYAAIATPGKSPLEKFIDSMGGRVSADWTLGKPLEEQSEDTIAFISKVLGV